MKGSIEYYWSGWKVVREIGKGSYGSVYEVEREDFGQVIKSAIKVISIPQNSNETQVLISEGNTNEGIELYYEEFVKKLIKEFAIMAELRGNSNIVSYEDHKIIKRDHTIGYDIFIKMELLNNYYTFFQNRNVSVDDILKIGIDLCNALEVCERKKIIHRDIKPDNIFYNDMGVFKLGDFGVAREIAEMTQSMTRMGTYNYMAPEIYFNKKYDHTVDIYSLGLVLYKSLNGGRLPFIKPGDVMTAELREAAFSRRISGEVFPIPAGCDEDVASAIIKACAFEPKDRYQSAAEFRAVLEELRRRRSESRDVIDSYFILDFEPTERSEELANIVIEGGMTVLTGSMMGTHRVLKDSQPLLIGRDVKLCDFVIPDTYMGVSRTHCIIYFNRNENAYYIKDSSTNGTWSSPTARLEKGKFCKVAPGTVILLGNIDCSIKLG